MKKHMRCALSWICWFFGDLIARISHVLPDWSIFGWIYYPYNRLMIWSGELDTGDCGLWQASETESDGNGQTAK